MPSDAADRSIVAHNRDYPVPDPTSAAAPLFSIILPLDNHRGQWKKALEAWQGQAFDQSAYEIVLVVPPDFPEPEALDALSGARCRLAFSVDRPDMRLCALGASRATGKYLVITESHVWPEPDVLALCRQAFDQHPDWAGFACRSIAEAHDRLSEAEAEMYSGDIHYGTQIHPWRRVVYQCFVTRRDAYEACGGIRSELGNFSEWALSEAYFKSGFRLGNVPEARCHHYYGASFRELASFTRDFTAGEIRYFSQDSDAQQDHLLEKPIEWMCQANLDCGLARAIVRCILQSAWSERRWMAALSAGRWIVAAVAGDALSRWGAAAATVMLLFRVELAARIGSPRHLSVRYRKFVAALIRYQRLASIKSERRVETRMRSPLDVVTRYGLDHFIRNAAGFYPEEIFHGTRFRWSETAAAVRINAPAGRTHIRLSCLSVRPFDARTELRFYVDGRLVPTSAVSLGTKQIDVAVLFPRTATFTLGWTCRAFSVVADARRFGLPITGIDLMPQPDGGTPA